MLPAAAIAAAFNVTATLIDSPAARMIRHYSSQSPFITLSSLLHPFGATQLSLLSYFPYCAPARTLDEPKILCCQPVRRSV